MSWQCNLCETLNCDNTIVCEVCNSVSPFLACFKYDYEEANKAIVSWLAENTLTIEVFYNQKNHIVTNWKAARVRLNGTVNVITFKLANDTAERIYTFGIPIKK